MEDNDKPETRAPLSIINEEGEEIPVTEAMIDEAILNAKSSSIGKHTIPVMDAITDEMIEAAQNSKDEDKDEPN